MYLATIGLFLAVSGNTQDSVPQNRCEIATRSWCMLRTATSFDVDTTSADKRIWTIRGSYLGSSKINIIESRACSAELSDHQSRSDMLGKSEIDNTTRYIIEWSLRSDKSCKLRIELPVDGSARDEVSYDFIVAALRACTDERCVGPTLSSTPLNRIR